ncbi:MAG: diguanylate cyclase [Betaproteobacteria bacterium]|nr:diguanylate cyclase [Betaproteobacteria bacterium]
MPGDLAALDAPATHRAAAQNGLGPDDVFAVWDLVADAWPCWAKILAVETAALPRRGPGHRRAAPEPPPALPPGAVADICLRVMAIGASGALRTQVASLLDRSDIAVTFADFGEEALKIAVAELPQLIIIDWTGRAAGGTQICQTLRESGIGRTAYILVLSPRQGERELLAALKAGADEFLALPVSREVLDAHLRVARRLVALKEEVQRDREEIRHYAAELAVANRRLQELAGSDPLTGLPNRRFAMDHVAREWQSAQSSGEPLSCLMIDVDNFKRINDTHGHDVGDQVLANIAHVLRNNARAETPCAGSAARNSWSSVGRPTARPPGSPASACAPWCSRRSSTSMASGTRCRSASVSAWPAAMTAIRPNCSSTPIRRSIARNSSAATGSRRCERGG